ncbi:MAG: hypothetical protein JJU12_02805 [Chlamydiales bacterium]|nr:hypothetical protein [Chlamydiales bacterium]
MKKESRFWEPFWSHRIEILSGTLLIVGLVLSFFYLRLGGALVGLGFGVCFYEEMHNYFIQLRDLYIANGVFKTLILIGTVVFFLIAIPIFIIACAVGYGALYLIDRIAKR